MRRPHAATYTLYLSRIIEKDAGTQKKCSVDRPLIGNPGQPSGDSGGRACLAVCSRGVELPYLSLRHLSGHHIIQGNCCQGNVKDAPLDFDFGLRA